MMDFIVDLSDSEVGELSLGYDQVGLEISKRISAAILEHGRIQIVDPNEASFSRFGKAYLWNI